MYEFANKRWQRAIDAMLENITGVRHIHLLQIIGLVDTDYNCGLKILYVNRLMKNAEETGLSGNQWGGRAIRSAPACATRRFMTYQSSRIMHKTIAIGSADKSNCFDCLTPLLTNAVNKKKGMDRITCRCDNKVMEGMKRNVKTAFGVSKSFYNTNHGDTQHSQASSVNDRLLLTQYLSPARPR